MTSRGIYLFCANAPSVVLCKIPVCEFAALTVALRKTGIGSTKEEEYNDNNDFETIKVIIIKCLHK